MGCESRDLDTVRTMRAVLAELAVMLGPLSQDLRAAALLRVAAEIVESAAYELAGSDNASRVARLILTAAEVSRLADSIGGEVSRSHLAAAAKVA